MENTEADTDLGLKMMIGPDEVSVERHRGRRGALVQLENPVVNPPFNNWSVYQPSPPHDSGLNGKEDLGQNIIVDGHRVHF